VAATLIFIYLHAMTEQTVIGRRLYLLCVDFGMHS